MSGRKPINETERAATMVAFDTRMQKGEERTSDVLLAGFTRPAGAPLEDNKAQNTVREVELVDHTCIILSKRGCQPKTMGLSHRSWTKLKF